jgi:hypothetical protein
MVILYGKMSRISCSGARGILDKRKKIHGLEPVPSLSQYELSLTQAL